VRPVKVSGEKPQTKHASAQVQLHIVWSVCDSYRGTKIMQNILADETEKKKV